MSASPEVGHKLHMKDLKNIEIERIDRNPENPRLIFTEEEMQRLAESISLEGILVPVVVFEEGDRYVLIDGERRWRCALELGIPRIPAIVVDPPDERQKLVQMFNIHMVRQEWEDMPTAWALQKLMGETGVEADQGLSDMTGLSVERIRRLKHALELPEEYQTYIHNGEIPLNFFWELKRAVIDPLAKRRPKLWAEFGEGEVLTAFVQKRLDEITTDTVSLRDVRPIINMAADEVDDPMDDSPLDDTLRELVRNPIATIQDAYEDTVMVIVEADKLQRRSDNMVKAFARLFEKARSKEEKHYISSVGKKLASDLSALVDAAA
jgi:ParB family chromosome partitioning protein